MRLALGLLLIALGTLRSEATAQCSDMSLSAAGLLDACTKTDYEWIGLCNGYIQAAFDANSAHVCAPKGVTRDQFCSVIVPALHRAPDLLQSDAVSAVRAILSRAYPCK
jgi:hypothetical protein